MEQEHTKPTSNWQEFWQILRHGQFGKLFAGATENTLIQFFRYCFVGGAANCGRLGNFRTAVFCRI